MRTRGAESGSIPITEADATQVISLQAKPAGTATTDWSDAMAAKRSAGEPLRIGAVTTSMPSEVGASSSRDQRAISVIFDGLRVTASSSADRIASTIVSIAVPILGGPGSGRIAADIRGNGVITDDRGGRFVVSALSNRRVRSVFRKESDDFLLHWEQPVRPGGVFLTSIAITAMADRDGADVTKAVDSVDSDAVRFGDDVTARSSNQTCLTAFISLI